jgi:hypothetical protein
MINQAEETFSVNSSLTPEIFTLDHVDDHKASKRSS